MVKENQLSDPSIITEEMCRSYILERGKGWLCFDGDELAGFSIVDLTDNELWALFVRPEQEGKTHGTTLHNLSIEWYFGVNPKPITLSTERGTRAESFYHHHGWEEIGIKENGEVIMKMTKEKWGHRLFRTEESSNQ